MSDKSILEEYDFYQQRLDKAIAYNDSVKAIECDSKEFKVLVDIINQLSKIEAEIKGIN
ncbi:hypothetical protein [Clostridium sp.]|uniref:hypothetical protein n=1 Tax=Clostridium sp. TaxID=1506 RepID=UPI003F39A56E